MSKIDDKHPEYLKRLEQWKRCDDAIGGGDSIKARGEHYLAKLPGQSPEYYKNYLRRALWYNATGRTLEGLTGLAFSVPPKIEAPTGMDEILADCNLMGKPFASFAEDVMEEVIGIGRFGILVDHPPLVEGVMKADMDPLGLRPYVIAVEAESIINWSYARILNRYQVSRVVIEECEDGDSSKLQYRELILLEGLYHHRIWLKRDQKFEIVSDITPVIGGSLLNEIPFWFVGPEFGDMDCGNPPLLDLVDLNISHYRTMADLEHGRFFCGLPTPIFAGFGFEKDAEVKLGSMGGIQADNVDAKAYYLEFQGQGLEALERAAAQKEAMMAKLGARMLAEDKKVGETAEALRIRASGESSALASIAASVSATLTKVLKFLCRWKGVDESGALFTLSTDYEMAGLSAQQLTALLAAVQGGELPRLDFFRLLQKHEVIAPDRTFEDFQADTPEPGTGLPGIPKP